MNTYVITDYGVESSAAKLQTAQIQAVLDFCKEDGGTVVVPAGEFLVSSLWMWSNTTLLLKEGAHLLGSEDCNDYEIFPVPEGVEMCSDMELIPQQYVAPWEAYRRAMISSYGEHNLAIIGEGPDSIIDGQNCYDSDGEEGYRGPHGIYFTNCDNVNLRNYTCQHSGNFMHQLDKCNHVRMEQVQCYGGSDGIHLHCCIDTEIQDCIFLTGDDPIAGINVHNLTVRNCKINSSCNAFRIGGVDILVEDCHIYGPGYYPHRKTIVNSRYDILPREAGRHNMLALVDYFASYVYPDEPSRNIVFRNCLIENLEHLLYYQPETALLQKGTILKELILENVHFVGLNQSALTQVPADKPLYIKMRNVEVSFRENAKGNTLLNENDPNTHAVDL